MRKIDEWLNSEETGEPFAHCVRCRLPLLETATSWLVNKEFHRGECILEYAICVGCRDAVTKGISEASKAAVREFLEQKIDWEERCRTFALSTEVARHLDACVVCEVPREELQGFGISAHFDDEGQLVIGALPLLICQPCIGTITALLSDESREVWKKFVQSYLAGLPGSSPGPNFPGIF